MSGSAFISIAIMVGALGYAFTKYRSRSFSMRVLIKSFGIWLLAVPFMLYTALDPTSVDFTVVLLMLGAMFLTGPGILGVNKMNSMRGTAEDVQAAGEAVASTAKEVSQEDHASKSGAVKRTATKGAENLSTEMAEANTIAGQGAKAVGETVKKSEDNSSEKAGWLQDDVLRLKNYRDTPVVSRIGIRRESQTKFKEKIEVSPTDHREWTDVPMNPPFEVGILVDDEFYTANFRTAGRFEIEVEIGPERVDISNIAEKNNHPTSQQSSVEQARDAGSGNGAATPKRTQKTERVSEDHTQTDNAVDQNETSQRTEQNSGSSGFKYITGGILLFLLAPLAGSLIAITGVQIPGLRGILSLVGIVGGLGMLGIGTYRFLR